MLVDQVPSGRRGEFRAVCHDEHENGGGRA
jgi:hypothetical protein